MLLLGSTQMFLVRRGSPQSKVGFRIEELGLKRGGMMELVRVIGDFGCEI